MINIKSCLKKMKLQKNNQTLIKSKNKMKWKREILKSFSIKKQHLILWKLTKISKITMWNLVI